VLFHVLLRHLQTG